MPAPQDRTPDVLPFLDRKLNDLMQALFRNREILTQLQQGASTTPAAGSMLMRIGEAIVIVREQERTVADIQRYLNSLRQHR